MGWSRRSGSPRDDALDASAGRARLPGPSGAAPWGWRAALDALVSPLAGAPASHHVGDEDDDHEGGEGHTDGDRDDVRGGAVVGRAHQSCRETRGVRHRGTRAGRGRVGHVGEGGGHGRRHGSSPTWLDKQKQTNAGPMSSRRTQET